jgi:hypothetical protein
MKLVLFLILNLSFFNAMAIDCNVIVYTQEEVIEKSFKAPMVSEGHDVPEFTFKSTINEVTAMADGKWLGITWSKNNEIIAESINLIRDMIDQPRVLIIYNPKNREEQVSLDCANNN